MRKGKRKKKRSKGTLVSRFTDGGIHQEVRRIRGRGNTVMYFVTKKRRR